MDEEDVIRWVCVSILSLRAEGDSLSACQCRRIFKFQSSPSGRRETRTGIENLLQLSGFNPLPPGGGRRGHLWNGRDAGTVSILSLRAEGDVLRTSLPNCACKFQSSPSGRRETLARLSGLCALTFQSSPSGRRETTLPLPCISTCRFQSSPSGRRETVAMVECPTGLVFQSSPSGRRETRFQHHSIGIALLFQSSPSGRRETASIVSMEGFNKVSILSLRAEGDLPRNRSITRRCGFNPLPPGGGRPTMVLLYG